MNNTDDNKVHKNVNYQLDKAYWGINPATPAFIELINSKTFIHPGKLVVTGSEKCNDAIAASKAGYDVTANGFSSEEIFYSSQVTRHNNSKINFLVEDIFLMCHSFDESFDTIYDYAANSSINHILYEKYIRKIYSILKTGGKLITILFPVSDIRDKSSAGINLIEFYSITKKYLQLEYSSRRISSLKSREGKEALQIYVKK